MSVTLLRHTRPDVGEGICYGRTDLQLCDSFEAELVRIIDELPGFDALVSSPLTRCRNLAAALGVHYQVAVRIDDRVQEMDFGDWEGIPWDDIPREQLREWEREFLHARPHGGESVAMLHRRTHDALADYRSTGRRTLVVTHSGVIRAACATGNSAADFDTSIHFGRFIALP